MTPRATMVRSRTPKLLLPALLTVIGLLLGIPEGTPAAATDSLSDSAVGPRPAPAAVAPWQQDVHYRIEARLDESTDVLSGHARIRYVNRSPDTLRHFYVHQYLNAFRPNSAWARHDLERGIRTFQDLGPEEHAFERITAAEVDGRAVEPFYPHAPDSTIAGFELPRPAGPGDSLTVDLRWDARLSTVPRRQGRRGRDYDFAQWYPRVVVYDLEGWRDHPLYRQGEFYGEFATYDVSLEVADDQVLGATGVPLEGDPGWEDVAAAGTDSVDHQRDWYGSSGGPPCVEAAGVRTCGVPGPERSDGQGPGGAEDLGFLGGSAPQGTKRVRWYAENVHHFAWSTSPDYIYEEGRYGDTVIRVLYRPGDEESWGDGVALERTATALAWTDSVFGAYPYPQVTNLHRIEPGGTEFPMVIMDGSASQSLIVHEIVHIYAHGILANNEWYEGWLDEGMATFLTSWFFERRGQGRNAWLGSEVGLIDLELRGRGSPVTYPAEDYPEYGVYGAMIYTKGSLILRMLRDMEGEERMIELLRTYYDRHRFRHVDGDAFQAVAEEVLRRDLDWFFGQWLHANGTVDYALRDVRVGRVEGGTHRTELEVERTGEMIMPVPVRLRGEGDEVRDTTVSGTGEARRVAIETPFRPVEVDLDPEGTILDWNGMNDRWRAGLWATGGVERELGRPLRDPPARRDRLSADVLPLLWANEAGGTVIGLQRRTSYMGSMHRSVLRVGAPGFEALDRSGSADDAGSLYYRIEDPVVRDEPRFGLRFETFLGEGRTFARASWERDVSALPLSGSRRAVRGYLLYAGVHEPDYLPAGRWVAEESRGAEAGLGYGHRWPTDAGPVALDLETGYGFSTRGDRWLRGAAELSWRGSGSEGWRPRLRIFAGGGVGRSGDGDWRAPSLPAERRFGVAGAGPYETLSDPWSRSRDALLVREVHHPGEGGLRGYDRRLMADRVVAVGGELATPRLGLGGLELGSAAFVDAGWMPRLGGGSDGDDAFLVDAGAGLELGWAGASRRLRIDVPFYVSDPGFARSARSEELGFRWAISVVSR